MTHAVKTVSSVILLLLTGITHSFSLKEGSFALEAGVFSAYEGKNQNISIQGLIGDQFTVTSKNNGNALIGLGYFFEGYKQDRFTLDYGVNAFYLANTKVSGTIYQELLFENLAYVYEVSHIPLYAEAKANIKTNYERLAVTLNAGIGPNFIQTSNYTDSSLDGGITQPDNAFTSHSSVAFSATAGIGLKFVPKGIISTPLECGYRFFFLGQGHLNGRSDQILDDLQTGNSYAHALVCSVTLNS